MTAPVLLLHGLGGCSFDWEHVASRLPGSVVVPEAPWHGGRPVVGDTLTFDMLAADALAAVDRHGVDEFVVAGLSMGAAIALTLLATRQERLRGVLLVAPAWLDVVTPTNLRPLQKVGRMIARRGLARTWDVLAVMPPLSGWDEDVRAQHRTRYLAFDPDAVSRALVELPAVLPCVPAEGAVRAWGGPVEVIGWPHDVIHPVELARRTAAAVGASVRVLQERPRPRDIEAELLAAVVEDVRRRASMKKATW